MLRLQHLQERPGPLASGGRLGTPPHSPRKHGMGPFPKDTAGPWPPVQRDRGGGGTGVSLPPGPPVEQVLVEKALSWASPGAHRSRPRSGSTLATFQPPCGPTVPSSGEGPPRAGPGPALSLAGAADNLEGQHSARGRMLTPMGVPRVHDTHRRTRSGRCQATEPPRARTRASGRSPVLTRITQVHLFSICRHWFSGEA